MVVKLCTQKPKDAQLVRKPHRRDRIELLDVEGLGCMLTLRGEGLHLVESSLIYFRSIRASLDIGT